MAEKRCYKCRETKHVDSFDKNRAKPDGRQNLCKLCKSAYNKKHQELRGHLFAERRRQTSRVRVEGFRKTVWEYLEEHPCIDCGETDPIVLQFDHRERGTKNGPISRLVADASWGAVEDEIKKCDVRCANCHARRTAKQFDWYKYIQG